MISTLSIKFNRVWATKLNQLLIPTEGRLYMSAVVQVQINVLGQITLTSLQSHCGRPHGESKSSEKCALSVKNTYPRGHDQDYSTGKKGVKAGTFGLKLYV